MREEKEREIEKQQKGLRKIEREKRRGGRE